MDEDRRAILKAGPIAVAGGFAGGHTGSKSTASTVPLVKKPEASDYVLGLDAGEMSQVPNGNTRAFRVEDLGLSFDTRAEAERGSTGAAEYIVVAGMHYAYDRDGTALRTGDGATWSPVVRSREIPVEAWGPAIDGLVDDQPRVQAAIDWAIAQGDHFVLLFAAGDWLLGGTLDLSAASVEYELQGQREQTKFLATPFGPAKALIKHASGRPLTVSGIQFGDGTAHKNHPIGMEMREAGRITLRDITAGGLGNTVLFCTRPFNSDWSGSLDLFFCGWQPLHKEVQATGDDAITLNVTEGDRTVIASSRVFEAKDVGEDIIIAEDPEGNAALVAQIVEVRSPFEAVVSRPPNVSGSGRRFSFGPVKADVLGSTVVFHRDIGLEAVDQGRMIYVDRAAQDGQTHTDRIARVKAGSECLLETPVAQDGTYRVFFTPTVYIGDHEVSGSVPNDIVIDKMLIEGFKGPGILVDQGLHIWLNNLKTHGRAWSEFSNFGMSAEAMIWNGAHKSRVDDWELEFCGKPANGGTVRVAGHAPGVSLEYMSLNAPLSGGYLFDFEAGDTDKSYLGIPEVNGRVDWDRFDGLFRTSSDAARRRVDGHGRVGGADAKQEASVQVPTVSGAVRAFPPIWISDRTAFYFRPAAEFGRMIVEAQDTPGYGGAFWFRMTNGGSTAVRDGRGISVELGTEDSLNVTADELTGLVTLENNSGAGRRFSICVFG